MMHKGDVSPAKTVATNDYAGIVRYVLYQMDCKVLMGATRPFIDDNQQGGHTPTKGSESTKRGEKRVAAQQLACTTTLTDRRAANGEGAACASGAGGAARGGAVGVRKQARMMNAVAAMKSLWIQPQ
jgi:hypothetical protein